MSIDGNRVVSFRQTKLISRNRIAGVSERAGIDQPGFSFGGEFKCERIGVCMSATLSAVGAAIGEDVARSTRPPVSQHEVSALIKGPT